MGKHSTDETIVEYGVQMMMKNKSPSAAARATVKKLHGFQNLFVGGGAEPVDIDAEELEEALWGRLVAFTTAAIPRIKPGKEHYAIDGTIQHFSQKPSIRAELKKRIVATLGSDPFPNDGT